MAVIGLGIDVVDVARAEAMLVPHRRRVLQRLLTTDELSYINRLKSPAKHLAVRLAAKEAVYKALQSLPGARQVGWRQIEVVRGEFGRPSIQLHQHAKELLNGTMKIHVSLTHSDLSAVAAAVLED